VKGEKSVTEAQQNLLQTIIDEFKVLSPETTTALIFNNAGQTLAKTESTTDDQARKVILSFGNITDQAKTIGGIESLTIQAESQLQITNFDHSYLTTVSTRMANPEILKSLTQVVVPTVFRLINQTSFKQPKEPELAQPATTEEEPVQEPFLPLAEENLEIEPAPDQQEVFEPILPSAPVNQFMVEKIGGLLIPADTVRIDGEVIASWSELYDGKQIAEVNIEALDGKKTTCKFKAIKETKNNTKGIIQIPEKILQALQTEKGKLVIVKPIIN